jgi:hypothetical protein
MSIMERKGVMSKPQRRLIAYTGSHGVGKSTAAAAEYRNQKILYPPASVRLLCDLEADCPFPINQNATEQTQKWIFSNQVRRELDALSRFDVVVTDRTIVDIVAYTFVSGFQDLAMSMLSFAEQHISCYDEITFKQVKFNRFCHDDGIRDAEDTSFRGQVEMILMDLYSQLSRDGRLAGKIHYA